MRLRVSSSRLAGRVAVPGSKSHTIRAVAIAALAGGESTIRSPLLSADTEAAVDVYRGLGADIRCEPGIWRVRGVAGSPKVPASPLDTRNSGTTMLFAMASCGLLRGGAAVLSGDYQIQRRPVQPMLDALLGLGARARSMKNNGCPPVEIGGAMRGGEISLNAMTSQPLSGLLINAPLSVGDTRIRIQNLNETPYIRMTLEWISGCGIRVRASEDLRDFEVPGKQVFTPFDRRIPADFSSATFFLAAGALPGNDITLEGLDLGDSQGDKAVIGYLREMGASFAGGQSGEDLRVIPAGLDGMEINLGDTPDSLPMMAALGCLAGGRTRLVGAAHARIKETDRIKVMALELGKMGGRLRELPDGLEIDGGRLRGAEVLSHDDHRVAMALAIAATAASGTTVINGAESVSVTFPDFIGILRHLGAKVEELP